MELRARQRKEVESPLSFDFERLPPELRELIYSFVVVEDEPLVVYQGTRLVRKLKDYTVVDDPRTQPLQPVQYNAHPTTVTETKVYPELPPLAFVSKAVRQEALCVYFRDNKFFYSLDTTPVKIKVRKWYNTMAPARFTKRWTVMLDFWMCTLAEPIPANPTRRTGSFNCRATVTITTDVVGKLVIKYEGALAYECCCQLTQLAQSNGDNRTVKREDGHCNTTLQFADEIQAELTGLWRQSNRCGDWSYYCNDCGKVLRKVETMARSYRNGSKNQKRRYRSALSPPMQTALGQLHETSHRYLNAG